MQRLNNTTAYKTSSGNKVAGGECKRKAITLEEKLDVIQRFERNERTCDIVRATGIKESTLRTIRDNAEKIKASYIAGTSLSACKSVRSRPRELEEMERLLCLWLEDQSEKLSGTSFLTIKEKALSIYEDLKKKAENPAIVPAFSASSGWFVGFKNRYTFYNVRCGGEVLNTHEERAMTFRPKPLAHQQRSPLAISDLNQPVEFSSSDQLKVNSNNDIQKAIQPFNMNDVHLSSRSIIDIEQTGRSFGVKPRMKRLPKLKRQFGSGAKDLSVNRSHLSQRPSNQIRSHQRWIKESTGNSSVGEQHFDVVLNKNSVEYNSKVPKINSNSIAHSLSDEVVVLPQSTIPAVQKEKRTLVVPNHQVAVMSNLFSMWKVGRLCDSYISNGTTNVMVHKMVLGAVCPKVLPILYNTSSSLFPKVTFPSSVSKEALLAFAEYMYSGVLDLNEDILVQLKTIGERLDMKDFEQLCSNELNKAKTKDILSAVVEPLLAEPCSLSGLLPSRTHGDSNEVQNSMLMKILGNIYSNNSMQTDVPVTIASTSASSSSSVSDVRSAENMATDQIVDIKTEVESEIEPATNHNSLQLKMEPCSPGENQYSIQEELFMDISNITSNNNLHLTPGTSATSGNIINNQYRNDLNMDSNDIINISDIPQSEETCLSQHTEDCDKDTDNQKELQLISVTSATGNISEDSLSNNSDLIEISSTICTEPPPTSNSRPYPVSLFSVNGSKIPTTLPDS
ncbi:uncharacterized protein LOC115209549 isoform X2 [Octopus sinensis]|uniref:Uncharacterized protein LOC115209549 isoform X2 n=1 Tax=Octopus sinensis TaxID=2607531 RepID=A0A7E6ENV9_9MOLL|nr:uncharacterized protein LOC115209549 isoform X2 [Octopus sinensis]